MERIENEKLCCSFLERNDLLTLFSKIDLKQIQLYRILKGEIICTAGEKILEMYFIVEGKVKIYTTTPDDKRLILRFQKAFGVIGDFEFIRGDVAHYTVEASSNCWAIGIAYQTLRTDLGDDSAFLTFLLEMITHKFQTKMQASSLNLLYPAEVRVASYLLSISTDGEGSLSYKEMEALSLIDVADMVGTSYRHLNRIIQKMCVDQIIERKEGKIHIKDIKKLRELAKDNIYE